MLQPGSSRGFRGPSGAWKRYTTGQPSRVNTGTAGARGQPRRALKLASKTAKLDSRAETTGAHELRGLAISAVRGVGRSSGSRGYEYADQR